jgi:uncharacterized protein (TIGR00369 family)
MPTPKLNGLELLKRVKDGIFPHPTMAATIPMKIISVEKGTIEFKAVASDRHLNPMGGVHGGFAATVLDSVTGCAVHSMLAAGEEYSTVDLNIKMLRPVPRGKELRAKGKVIHMSKRLGISEAELTDDEGRIYAHATSTCMIFPNKEASQLVALKSSDRHFREIIATNEEQTDPAHERIVHRRQSEPLTQSNEGRIHEMREEESIIAEYREGGFGKRLNLYLGYRSLRKEFLEVDRSEIPALRKNQAHRPGFRSAFKQFVAMLLPNM